MRLKTLLFCLFTTLTAHAGVNLNNGNFYINYTDIVVPGGGQDLEITRTYNSKSPANGWFGHGWGSTYETNLIVSPDGSVIVQENGGGANTRFIPSKPIDPSISSRKVVEAMKKKNTLSKEQADDYYKKFMNDASLRTSYALQFGVTANLPAGTKLYSNVRGQQVVEVKDKGYVRVFSNGKKEHFTSWGKLSRVEHKNGYHIDLEYNSRGLVKSMKDSQAKQLTFEWYPNGKIKQISATGNVAASYKFDDNENLTESTDAGKNNYKYSYDNFHNMIGVDYSDGSKMKMEYDRKYQFVTKVTMRNGDVTEYKYGSNPKNPERHYWTEVTKKPSNAKASHSKYEYELKSRNDGEVYTYRIKTEINGLVTETIYNADSLPVKIQRGTLVTNFKYDNGKLVEKTDSLGNRYMIEYEPKLNKIAKVTTKEGWTKFRYEPKRGNLVRADSSSGQSVLLIYDSKDRIVKMIDSSKKSNDKRTLAFKYNAMDKPVEIEMIGVGKINVIYDNYGEIKKVESLAGQNMALQVTQAFQALLAIVKPAGIDLNL